METNSTLIEYIAIPIKEFRTTIDSIHTVLINSKTPVVAQFMGSYWESTISKNRLDHGITHILIEKSVYINSQISKHYSEIITITTPDNIINLYNNISNVYTGYGKDNIYEVNNVLFKLKETTIFYYKDKPYRVISEGMMKINDVWIESVNYTAIYEEHIGKTFTKPKKEFYDNYKPR